MPVFLYLRKRRKCRKREYNETRLSFGFSDIRATYARYLTPQIAKKIFFLFSFHLRALPLCLFSSLPRSCSHLAVLSAASRTRRAFTLQLQKRNFNWSKKSPLHNLFFFRPRLYLRTNRGFSSKGVTFIRAMKEVSAKWKSPPDVLYFLKKFLRKVQNSR